MQTRVCRLGYVGVETSDRSAWARFATQILGMQAAGPTSDGGELFRMDDKHHRLALHPGDRDDIAYAGWEVADEAALDDLARHLSALGHAIRWGAPDEAAERGVARLFTVVDPAGVTNEIYVGLGQASEPFQSPRAIDGFVTGELGAGHIVLCVDDYEACLRFYRDGLGLKISDYIAVDMGPEGTKDVVFLHAGPRHHALALVPVAAPKRLHHMMVQVKDMKDVGTTYDLCQDAEVPIAITLGCHSNDRMVSFYMQSPAGFQVEYGFGGIEIDDRDWEVAHYDGPSIWGHRSPAA